MMTRRTLLRSIPLASAAVSVRADSQSESIDLRSAVIVVRPGSIPAAERAAAVVLSEEIDKRTGIRLATSTAWPRSGAVIALVSDAEGTGWKRPVPSNSAGPEGYRLMVDTRDPASQVIWILGKDARGALFGVGQLLRRLEWASGRIAVSRVLDITTSPAYPIRGHQLGYRAQANSYDAWDQRQFDQYIRELTFFGVNSIEGIPLQDDRPTPVMKVPRREMNQAIGRICANYGLDYWAWIPADFDLSDRALRDRFLARCSEFFKDTPVLNGVFFPGGDPGHNPPELVLPFLEDMAALLLPVHSDARIWLSLQWFSPPQVDTIYEYIERRSPRWFAGLIAGPSSRPIPETRTRLAKQYRLRDYPDLTHNKLCQYEVPSWDQAFALTLGREAINPRPAEFARIHNRLASYTDGFISYSDGIHDDVNKTVWSALSWDPETPVRDILTDYAGVYFQPSVATAAADGILALERNWHGPLIHNGAVESTLLSWQRLESSAPQLAGNWRWQMCLLRAYYDAYVRRRLINESLLETQANGILAGAEGMDADRAMDAAMSILNRAVSRPINPDIRTRIEELCAALYASIGLQSSVPKYHAIGAERGAVLDFVDYPLNNRWWLEDEFKKIRALTSEAAKVTRLHELAAWENPGRGSFYDDVGNIAKSPHVVQFDEDTAPETSKSPHPTFWWWDQGKSRARLSWQSTMWPAAMVYEGLDPDATYTVRSSGYGQALLRVNGERIEPSVDGKEIGDIKEFPVPAKFVRTRKLILTWDPPKGEEHLNWRQHSRLAEVWLVKRR
jgi:hypothetical protein